MSRPQRVLVTGAGGLIGGIVRERLGERYRLTPLTRRPASFSSEVADLGDLEAVERAAQGHDAIVHLAASSSVESDWTAVLRDNLVATYHVFEAARRAGVRRVVFASSNHAIGMYEADGAPALYELDDPRRYGIDAELRPDSLYGVSKVYGEALGRLYADRYGLEVVCLRIGGVVPNDDPAAPRRGRPFEPLPELTPDQARKRMRAVWLSHRDCASLIERALEADVRFAIVYGTSNNPRQFWDLEPARRRLGFEPVDAAPVGDDAPGDGTG